MMGDLHRHDQSEASSLEYCSNVLSVHVFFVWRERNHSSDTGVAGVSTFDGPILVKLALLVEPRRPCRYTQSKHFHCLKEFVFVFAVLETKASWLHI